MTHPYTDFDQLYAAAGTYDLETAGCLDNICDADGSKLYVIIYDVPDCGRTFAAFKTDRAMRDFLEYLEPLDLDGIPNYTGKSYDDAAQAEFDERMGDLA